MSPAGTHLCSLVELPEVNHIIVGGLFEGYHVLEAVPPQDIRGLVGEACLHGVARGLRGALQVHHQLEAAHEETH